MRLAEDHAGEFLQRRLGDRLRVEHVLGRPPALDVAQPQLDAAGLEVALEDEPRPLDAAGADTEDGPALAELPGRETPADVAYDRAWVKSVMGRALQRLEAECAPRRLLPVLKALEPILYRDPGHPGYAELAAGLGSSEGALKVAAHRLRTRLRSLIREEVAQTVASPEDLEEELKHLLRVFEA